MKYFILWGAALFLAATPALSIAQTNTSALIVQLQQQLAALQAQVAALTSAPPSSAGGTGTSLSITQTLQRGSRGDQVTSLQTFLSTHQEWYPEKLVTGYFGALTEAAVKRFQSAKGIESVGIVGPKTRAALSLLMLPGAPAPTPAPDPLPTPSPTPMPTPPPATTTPNPMPAPTPVPPTPPLSNPNLLSQPFLASLAWSDTGLVAEFNHDPGAYTRAYAIYIKTPSDSAEQKVAALLLPSAIGDTSSTSAGTLTRIGNQSWRYFRPLDLLSHPDGDTTLAVRPVGDGDVEGASSPGFIATLHPHILLYDFTQGTAPIQAVENGTVTRYPLTMKIENSFADLYYRYRLLDGSTMIWDSAYIRQSSSSKIASDFNNVNNYSFSSTTTYTLHVDSYNNNAGANSTIKQKPASKPIKFNIQ